MAYGLRVRGISSASELQNRIAASLLAVGLDPAVFLRDRRRHELSGGECQRVALAARLALRPRVLLMDEPTASVDQQSAERIARAARHAADSGSAVVVVSHDHEWITPLSDRLVTLREGKLVEWKIGGGRREPLKRSPSPSPEPPPLFPLNFSSLSNPPCQLSLLIL